MSAEDPEYESDFWWNMEMHLEYTFFVF
jgi:hypothetical protein